MVHVYETTFMAAEGASNSVHGVDAEVLRRKLRAFGAYI
jgi:hypothetical protein